jgi:ubiquinone biosynthesis UbiH/UbiF/VisC/COQ6 family hydroxylase
MKQIDILIAGAGLVGLALAAALANTHYTVGIVDHLIPPTDTPSLDSRIYAISPRSQRFLNQNEVWPYLSTQRITAIRQMKIAEQETFFLHFDALEVGIDALATTVENQCLQAALWRRLQDADNIVYFMPHTLHTLLVKPEYAEVTLDNQQVIHTKLLVGADGAHSFVRANMGSAVHIHDYQQQAIVANFCCERPHQGTAYQWFYPEGILAWLPLPNNKMSMVWSVDKVLAEELRVLPIEALTQKVARLGGQKLGKLTMLGRPAAFPLYLTHVAQWVTPRLALVGDAAHTLHPLAGQGVNLGFGDVEVLARLLLAKGVDPGKRLLLRQYERERREAIYKMQGVTHALKKLFNNTHPILRPLRQLGLRCTDRVGFIKRQLMQAALN